MRTLRVAVRCFLLGLVALSIGTESSHATTIKLSRQLRATALGQGTQEAQHIVVATVTDTAYFAQPDKNLPEHPWIYTRFSLTVDTVLKGPVPATPVTFAQRGGVMGKRSAVQFPSYPFKIGNRYLLFLVQCDSASTRQVSCPACIARVEGDTSVTANPRGSVSTAALLDTVRNYLRVCSYKYQARKSDIAVLGKVTELDVLPSSDDFASLPGKGTLRVESFFRRREGPSLPMGMELSFSVPRAPKWDSPDAQWMTKAPIVPGETYILFLDHDTGSWSLLPSIYAAWRKDGDDAVVQTRGYPCPFDVERVPWEEIMGFLRK